MGVMAQGMVPGAIPGFASKTKLEVSLRQPLVAFTRLFCSYMAQSWELGARPEALPGRSRGAVTLHPGLRRIS